MSLYKKIDSANLDRLIKKGVSGGYKLTKKKISKIRR
jgi:hypothetical protein